MKKSTPAIPRKKQAVVYFGRVPHEFSEKEIRVFFGQFGRILKLRLSRSKRTARSKGYGYIQYELAEVAKIVGETTNNHFIAGKPITVKHMTPESVWPKLFEGHNRKFRDVRPTLEAKRRKLHNSKTHEATGADKIDKDAKRAAKMAELGIEYDFSRKVITDDTKAVIEEPKPVEEPKLTRSTRANRAAKNKTK